MTGTPVSRPPRFSRHGLGNGGIVRPDGPLPPPPPCPNNERHRLRRRTRTPTVTVQLDWTSHQFSCWGYVSTIVPMISFARMLASPVKTRYGSKRAANRFPFSTSDTSGSLQPRVSHRSSQSNEGFVTQFMLRRIGVRQRKCARPEGRWLLRIQGSVGRLESGCSYFF